MKAIFQALADEPPGDAFPDSYGEGQYLNAGEGGRRACLKEEGWDADLR
jgi:hypothetical protein